MKAESQKRTLQAQKATVYAVLTVFSIVYLLPLAWMISTSLKSDAQSVVSPPVWIPNPVLWDNFYKAYAYNADKLGFVPFLVYARNSMLLVILTVAGAVLSNSIVAYSFARMRWPGRDLIFNLTLATMMIPFPVLMVPTFALYRDFGWIGTFRPLYVAAFFGGAFNIFLLRQFFKGIPMELSEAAKIDGCSEWQTFYQVILPLAKPALAVVALFTLMGTWNDFLGPLIYLQNQQQFTLSLGLQQYQSQAGGTSFNLLMAASTLVIAPIIVLFFFTQKLFIQGIAATGLKG
ncbi:MAG: carbohydrate ABC transporter permease [Armatimonadetes bacterium]|nr:carbohydrate ABC transporter permease [Armatimonadota bacterium]